MSFIKNVWGGHDYIPHVWAEWMSDRRGRMFVVEVGGTPVGMNRVRFLEDGSAWFEGVRIHPDYRGRGLASMLGENSMKVASAKGATVFRLTSNSRNRQAHRQVARIRFNEVSRISVYSPPDGVKPLGRMAIKAAGVKDLLAVRKVVELSKEFVQGAGVMWDGFTAISLTPDVIARRIREGSVFIAKDAVAIAMPGKEGNEVWSQICFLCGEPKAAVGLAKGIFSSKGKADWKLAYIPQGSPLIGALRRAGFRRSFSLILFQRGVKG
ncbi:MAG: GNAT family N-acetyltransferase [Thaumarchaeota archaeon]|nr:GNAT family N-acetyltransferase [Nitrososphaerota archaeon]